MDNSTFPATVALVTAQPEANISGVVTAAPPVVKEQPKMKKCNTCRTKKTLIVDKPYCQECFSAAERICRTCRRCFSATTGNFEHDSERCNACSTRVAAMRENKSKRRRQVDILGEEIVTGRTANKRRRKTTTPRKVVATMDYDSDVQGAGNGGECLNDYNGDDEAEECDDAVEFEREIKMEHDIQVGQMLLEWNIFKQTPLYQQLFTPSRM